MKKGYIANKMTGIPYFNAPWFDYAEAALKKLGYEMFNPAQHDRSLGLDPMLCPNGTQEEALAAGGVGLRKVLGDDATWITENSEFLILGPDWHRSPGAIFELALHQALRLPAWEFDVFIANHAHPELLEYGLMPPVMDCKEMLRFADYDAVNSGNTGG